MPVIGKTYRHPENGRPLVITGGNFMVDGRLSNWWEWRYLDGNRGYGRGYDRGMESILVPACKCCGGTGYQAPKGAKR